MHDTACRRSPHALAGASSSLSTARTTAREDVKSARWSGTSSPSAVAVDSARAAQTDNIRELRWWSVTQLRATTETVYPAGLADLVVALVEERTLEWPVVLD